MKKQRKPNALLCWHNTRFYVKTIFITALVVQFNIFAAERIHVIITADSGYPPYSFLEKGKPHGIYYNILKKILKNFDHQYDIEIRPLPWNEAVNEVKNGQAFAVYPPYKIPESRPWMDYSDPILQETISVFCQDSVKKWPDNYKNANVGINYGFAYPPFVTKLLRQYKMHVFALDNNEVALKYFRNKKIDCYINDREAVLYTNNNLHFPPINEVSVLFQEDSYIGFSSNYENKFKYKKDFIRKFNKNLHDMKKNGSLNLIVNDFINRNK